MCQPFDQSIYPTQAVSLDEWTRRLNDKYGITQPTAPDEVEDTQPAPCSAATRAGERTP